MPLVVPLDPSRENAQKFRNVQYDDYLRIGMTAEEAALIAGINDTVKTDKLVEDMRSGPRSYYGMKSLDRLVAVAALGDWLYGDEQPFISKPEFIVRRSAHKLMHALDVDPAHDSGLHAFAIASRQDFALAAEPLLTHMKAETAVKGHRWLKAAIDTDDEELIDVFTNVGGKRLKKQIASIAINDVERNYFLYGIET